MKNNTELTRTTSKDELLKKMQKSQNHFVAWLKELPVDEILDLAFEYSLREDIIYLMEEVEPDEEVVEVLLQLNDPLKSIADMMGRRSFEAWNDLIAAAIAATAQEARFQRRSQELIEAGRIPQTTERNLE